MNDSEEVLTPAQVAKRYGVTASTVSRWADEGKVRSFRTPGGHRRFRAADLTLVVIDGEELGAAS